MEPGAKADSAGVAGVHGESSDPLGFGVWGDATGGGAIAAGKWSPRSEPVAYPVSLAVDRLPDEALGKGDGSDGG
jgi:hypothetical protein